MAFPIDTEDPEEVPKEIKDAIIGYITEAKFRATNFDQNGAGFIADGGEDAYDHGHYFTTSECGGNYNQPIRPWELGNVPTASACLGAEGAYQISQYGGIMTFYG